MEDRRRVPDMVDFDVTMLGTNHEPFIKRIRAVNFALAEQVAKAWYGFEQDRVTEIIKIEKVNPREVAGYGRDEA